MGTARATRTRHESPERNGAAEQRSCRGLNPSCRQQCVGRDVLRNLVIALLPLVGSGDLLGQFKLAKKALNFPGREVKPF